jgi:hypothetical protein
MLKKLFSVERAGGPEQNGRAILRKHGGKTGEELKAEGK